MDVLLDNFYTRDGSVGILAENPLLRYRLFSKLKVTIMTNTDFGL